MNVMKAAEVLLRSMERERWYKQADVAEMLGVDARALRATGDTGPIDTIRAKIYQDSGLLLVTATGNPAGMCLTASVFTAEICVNQLKAHATKEMRRAERLQSAVDAMERDRMERKRGQTFLFDVPPAIDSEGGIP